MRSPCQGVFRKRRCCSLTSAYMEHEYVCDRLILCLHCNTQIYDLQGRRVRCIAPAAAGSDMGANGTSNPLDFDELTEIIRRAVLTASLLARLTHFMCRAIWRCLTVQLAVQATLDLTTRRSEIQK